MQNIKKPFNNLYKKTFSFVNKYKIPLGILFCICVLIIIYFSIKKTKESMATLNMELFYGLDDSKNLYYKNSLYGEWKSMNNPNLSNISASKDRNTLWGITDNGDLYSFDIIVDISGSDSYWKTYTSKNRSGNNINFKYISANNDNSLLVGINNNNYIHYCRPRMDSSELIWYPLNKDNTYDICKISGKGNNNYLWAIDTSYNVYNSSGIFNNLSNNYTDISLSNITVNGDGNKVYGSYDTTLYSLKNGSYETILDLSNEIIDLNTNLSGNDIYVIDSTNNMYNIQYNSSSNYEIIDISNEYNIKSFTVTNYNAQVDRDPTNDISGNEDTEKSYVVPSNEYNSTSSDVYNINIYVNDPSKEPSEMFEPM